MAAFQMTLDCPEIIMCSLCFIPHNNDVTWGEQNWNWNGLRFFFKLFLSLLYYQCLVIIVNIFWLSSSLSPSSSTLYFYPLLPLASLWFFSFPTSSPSHLCLSLTRPSFCPSLWSFHVCWSHLVCLKPKEQRQAILDHTTKDPDTSERERRGAREREREIQRYKDRQIDREIEREKINISSSRKTKKRQTGT